MEDKELRKLLKENLTAVEEVKEMVKDIKRHMLWQKVWFILKILLIVVPIVIGLLYLPSYLEDMVGKYKNIFSSEDSESAIEAILQGGSLNTSDLQKYLK